MKVFHKKTTATASSADPLIIAVAVTTVLMAAICAVLLCSNGYKYFHHSGRYITIEMKTPVAGYGQLYFDMGRNYRENDSYRFEIRPTSSFEKYRIPLPESAIRSVRFDPLDKAGPFEIKSLTIETRDDKVIWDGDKLAEQIVPLQQMASVNTKAIFAGVSTGEDPNFHVNGFTIPAHRRTLSRVLVLIVVFMTGIALMGGILFLMLDSLRRSGHPASRKKLSLLQFIQNITACGLALVIIGFYVWTATSNFKSFRFVIDSVYHYTDVLVHRTRRCPAGGPIVPDR